ncbi:uncharacterized protein LOC143433512 [Xylocopa sonorina]|uniref:uncharacterized protein LOC143433512 n=1 Tax=Xylocopa sonorina TaxID=1818115 RepID=UPI00403B196B
MKPRIEVIPNEKRATENMGAGRKLFNKKNYRIQKYSNKYKINQWEERRKKAILRNFYKELDKDQNQNLQKPSVFKNNEQNENVKQPKKTSAFHKAKQEFLNKKDEKKRQMEQVSRMKAKREEAVEKYKKERMQAYKKLSKKTKKGQPVMKDRIEILLEKIERQVSKRDVSVVDRF